MAAITLLDLARHLGLSKSTVSVALRGRPGVSEKIRQHIISEATRLGYSPDPLAAELMAMIRANRQLGGGQVLAYVNTFREPVWMERLPTYRAFLNGAKEQAQNYGYRVEEFRAFENGMTPSRLCDVLKARGIRGVLIGPRWMNEPEIDFDWASFSSVLVGEARYGAGIYRVCNHHTHACALAIHTLVERGYKRIGIHLQSRFETVRGFGYTIGVDVARRELGKHIYLNVLLSSDNKMETWINRNKLDAVVSIDASTSELVAAMRTKSGEPVAYANLNKEPGTNWAGIEQHSDEIGKVAVNLLRSLLHAGERGTTSRPRIVLVEGSWAEGDTVRAPTKN